MLFAVFFIIVPNYYVKVQEFLQDFFTLKPLPGIPEIYLPYPENAHPIVYKTMMRFCAIFGLFQFGVLALRYYIRSSLSKVAETIGNIVSWLGVAYMFNLLLLDVVEWVPFIGGVIVVFGVSLIVRSLVVLLVSMYKHYM
jgi:hypothetical protein